MSWLAIIHFIIEKDIDEKFTFDEIYNLAVLRAKEHRARSKNPRRTVTNFLNKFVKEGLLTQTNNTYTKCQGKWYKNPTLTPDTKIEQTVVPPMDMSNPDIDADHKKINDICENLLDQYNNSAHIDQKTLDIILEEFKQQKRKKATQETTQQPANEPADEKSENDTTESDIAIAKVPYKKQTIPKPLREKVWKNAFYDRTIGDCYSCGGLLDKAQNYECGHIVAESKGGKTEENNLRPICRSCNRSMGTENMNIYKTKFNPIHLLRKKPLSLENIDEEVLISCYEDTFTKIEADAIADLCISHRATEFESHSVVGRLEEMFILEKVEYEKINRVDLISIASYFEKIRVCNKNNMPGIAMKIRELLREYLKKCKRIDLLVD